MPPKAESRGRSARFGPVPPPVLRRGRADGQLQGPSALEVGQEGKQGLRGARCETHPRMPLARDPIVREREADDES